MRNLLVQGCRVPVAAGAALLAMAGVPAQAQSLASYGATPGQVATGAALDASASSTAKTTIVNAIQALPDAYARADALGQLSPAAFTLLPMLAIQSLDAVEANVHEHLADQRNAKAPVGKLRLTLLGDLRQAHYNTRPDRPYATSDSRSLALAIDYQVKPGLVAGLTMGVDGIDTQLGETAPRSAVTTYHIGPYVGWSNTQFYAQASADYASANYKLFREVDYGTLNNQVTINGTRADDSWGFSLEGGYRLPVPVVTVEPYVGLHYRYAHTPEFGEAGGPVALDVAPFKAESVRTALGARATTTFKTGAWTLQPSASAEWRHELRGDVISAIEARFLNTDSPVFTLNPDQPGRNEGIYTAGLAATFREKTTLRVTYRGDFANDRRINGFMATLSRRI
jgi:uncharacterized protein with beta-barrel porin domain